MYGINIKGILSPGVYNSCGVLIAYLCKTYFVLNRQKWRKFDSWYHVRSVYSDKSVNANTEIAQVKILKKLQKLV